MKTNPTNDIYQTVTNQIVAAIEAGAGTYQMPWNPRLCGASPAHIPYNPVGRYAYKGINILSLWASQESSQFDTREWATYRQWLSIGGQVRKGERGTPTIFYKSLGNTSSLGNGDENSSTTSRGSRPFILCSAHVFNAAQVEGYTPHPITPPPDNERHAKGDHLIAASGAHIRLDGSRACYIPSRDEIHLPPLSAFMNAHAYYGVALHELCHWTGHERRCDRNLQGRFGSEAYAMEELIAELGAAFLSAELGITPEPRADHARYIASWLRVLKNDKRSVFTAAAKANQAATLLTFLTKPVPLATPSV